MAEDGTVKEERTLKVQKSVAQDGESEDDGDIPPAPPLGPMGTCVSQSPADAGPSQRKQG